MRAISLLRSTFPCHGELGKLSPPCYMLGLKLPPFIIVAILHYARVEGLQFAHVGLWANWSLLLKGGGYQRSRVCGMRVSSYQIQVRASHLADLHMSDSLNALKGGYIGDYIGN